MASATSLPPQETETIATMRAEQEIDGVFACVRKERQLSRAGTPYLTVELRDSTGSIVGRAFRDAARSTDQQPPWPGRPPSGR